MPHIFSQHENDYNTLSDQGRKVTSQLSTNSMQLNNGDLLGISTLGDDLQQYLKDFHALGERIKTDENTYEFSKSIQGRRTQVSSLKVRIEKLKNWVQLEKLLQQEVQPKLADIKHISTESLDHKIQEIKTEYKQATPELSEQLYSSVARKSHPIWTMLDNLINLEQEYEKRMLNIDKQPLHSPEINYGDTEIYLLEDDSDSFLAPLTPPAKNKPAKTTKPDIINKSETDLAKNVPPPKSTQTLATDSNTTTEHKKTQPEKQDKVLPDYRPESIHEVDDPMDSVSPHKNLPSSQKETDSTTQDAGKKTDEIEDDLLIFSEAFEIGKNMSLLKGRNLDDAKEEQRLLEEKYIREEAEKTEARILSQNAHSAASSDFSKTKSPSETTLPTHEYPHSDSKFNSTENTDTQQQLSSDDKGDHPNGNIMPEKSEEIDPTIRLLSERYLNSHRDQRSTLLVDIIWKLIKSKHYTMASQLAYQVDNSEGIPPRWLLRSMALTEHLCSDQGRISRQMEEEIANFIPQEWQDLSTEEKLSASLLARGAILKLSLIRPGKLTRLMLKSFKIRSDEIQLYNLLSRVANFGASAPRVSTALVSTEPAPSNEASSSPQPKVPLRDRVTTWIDNLRNEIFQIEPSTHIYKKPKWTLHRTSQMVEHSVFQEFTARISIVISLYDLMKSVRLNEVRHRTRVRQDLARLNEKIRMLVNEQDPHDGIEKNEDNAPVNRHPIVSSIEDGKALIEEWINQEPAINGDTHLLSDRNSNPAPHQKGYVVEELATLRQDFKQRLPSVIQELNSQLRTTRSTILAIGIEYMKEKLLEFNQLSSHGGLKIMQEPPAEQLLNIDFLGTDLTDFDANWNPSGTQEIKTQALLNTLAKTSYTSWPAVFDDLAHRGEWDILQDLKRHRTSIIKI